MTDAPLELALQTAVAKVKSGSVTLKDVLGFLYPKGEGELNPPATAPLPTVISDDEKEALKRILDSYGSVVPTERRELHPVEVDSLLSERETLKTIKKMVERREEAIRTTVFNHLDVEAEKKGLAEGADRDDKGFYLLEGVAQGNNPNQVFKREIREGSPSLAGVDLEALAEDPSFPEFTRQDYLSMTTQTRVFDENKAMLALKKNPDLIRAIAKAAKPGKRTSSMNVRKK